MYTYKEIAQDADKRRAYNRLKDTVKQALLDIEFNTRNVVFLLEMDKETNLFLPYFKVLGAKELLSLNTMRVIAEKYNEFIYDKLFK